MICVCGSKHVRLLSVPHRFHRSWPQDDLGAVERTRTIASGEAAGNDPSSSKCAFRALIWRETQNEQGEVSSNDSVLEYRWEVLIRIWIFFASIYPTLEDSHPCCLLSSPRLLFDSFYTCSSADVTLGCLDDGAFYAVVRHNDIEQKLSMPRTRRIGFHAYIRRVRSL